MEIGGFEEIIPLEDRVIVRPREEEEITSAGIIIPESVAEGAVRGTVIAVGPGKYTESGQIIPMMLKVGDEVLYGTKYFGTECIFNGESVIVIPQTNIFAILKPKQSEE